MPDVFADAEKLFLTWATGALDVRVLTELPANLIASLPLIQVVRFGGSDRDRVLDRANIAVDTFALTRDEAQTLALRVHAAVLGELPGLLSGTTTVTRVATISGPAWRPYTNTSVRRLGASYQLTLRSRKVVTP